jgi:hypothetical protein
MQADTETFGPHGFHAAMEHQQSEEKNERPRYGRTAEADSPFC